MWVCCRIILAALLCSPAWAASVLLVTKSSSHAAAQDGIRLASELYGLELQQITIATSQDSASVVALLRRPNVSAAIVSSQALADLSRPAFSSALRRADGSRIPLLIVVSGKLGESRTLFEWSGGRIQSCEPMPDRGGPWRMSFAHEADIARQLRGVALSAAGPPECSFVLSKEASVRVVARMENVSGEFPTFVQFSIDGQPNFVIAAMPAVQRAENTGTLQLQRFFTSIAGPAMFLRSAAGDGAWHLPGLYANLTIDDPWLTEPYGNLGYQALLNEMEKHKFHTTIAFIPWNYDRSQSQVVSLFRSHPDRYSLCIHGNNHNHREFGAYSNQPLERQDENVKQSVARMEEFEKITGLRYDRIMVFPHAIAPAGTLVLLKNAGYSATVNSENIPLGSSAPADSLLALRPWTLAFSGFPSIRRVSAEVLVSKEALAINAFLGNPQLFYVHQEVFAGNIGAFNATADEINRLEPDVRWASLGDIIQHLYLLRLRDDRNFDVLAISPKLELGNPTARRTTFYVSRPEDAATPLRSLLVDGAPTGYRVEKNNRVQFEVVLEPYQSRQVSMLYGESLNLAAVDVSTRSVLVALDRKLSDVRDMQLSRSKIGRAIQSRYYKYRFDSIEALAERSAAAILTLIVGGYLLRLLFLRKRRGNSHSTGAMSPEAPARAANLAPDESLPMRIGLIGASFETGNLGVGALAAGAIRCIHERWPHAQIYFFDYAKEPSVRRLLLDGEEVEVPLLNVRFSKRVLLPNNIALLLVIATAGRLIPFGVIRKWVVSRNRVLCEISSSAMMASIAGGDSFSDIYGFRRLLYVALPQILAIAMNRKLLLLPQTYGPFRSRVSRMVAKFITGNAALLHARDYLSLAEIDRLHGSRRSGPRAAFRYDVAFALSPVAPRQIIIADAEFRLESDRLVGLNISGLLYMGGYDKNNMFGLRVDYRELVSRIIDLFIVGKGASVLLVPHVLGNDANSESDVVASDQVYKAFTSRYGRRLGMLRGEYDQSEVKHVIGKCNFFVGSRMHACIAAMSQCVPAVAVAYSDKFIGVLEPVGVPSVVADARKLDLGELLALIENLYDRREVVRRELQKSMPQVVRAASRPFDYTGDYIDHYTNLLSRSAVMQERCDDRIIDNFISVDKS